MTQILSEKIHGFVSAYLRDPNLSPDTDIFESGLVDSLFAPQLVMFIETELGVTVDNEDLELANFASVTAVEAFVRRKQEAGPV
ncbi:acyl carrier protein [Roseibium sp. Sym1]|uniref:acyl carrier protein n=1 Tax=Roseibium sp. Sym1 TaxID=3016006 RepID=UPI0022B35CEE|nr:acyl carrier protein [Roseibium sp. Sym1]